MTRAPKHMSQQMSLAPRKTATPKHIRARLSRKYDTHQVPRE